MAVESLASRVNVRRLPSTTHLLCTGPVTLPLPPSEQLLKHLKGKRSPEINSDIWIIMPILGAALGRPAPGSKQRCYTPLSQHMHYLLCSPPSPVGVGKEDLQQQDQKRLVLPSMKWTLTYCSTSRGSPGWFGLDKMKYGEPLRTGFVQP